MKVDLGDLINEETRLENEMLPIFKKLFGSYDNFQNSIGKLEKSFLKIIEGLEKFGEFEGESPLYSLAKNYISLKEGMKQFRINMNEKFVLVLQELVQKSELLNELYDELNAAVKKFKKIKEKMEKVEKQLASLDQQVENFKWAKKLKEKDDLEPEFNFLKEKLNDSYQKFNKIIGYYQEERDGLLKKAILGLVDAQKKYSEIRTNFIEKTIKIARNLGIKI